MVLPNGIINIKQQSVSSLCAINLQKKSQPSGKCTKLFFKNSDTLLWYYVAF